MPLIKENPIPGTPGLASVRRYFAEGWNTIVFERVSGRSPGRPGFEKWQRNILRSRLRPPLRKRKSATLAARHVWKLGRIVTPLGPDEIAFISARDSFYMATVSETGWPYIQHRGGRPGFLRLSIFKPWLLRTTGQPTAAEHRQYCRKRPRFALSDGLSSARAPENPGPCTRGRCIFRARGATC